MTRRGIGSFHEEGDDYETMKGVVLGVSASGKAVKYRFTEAEEEKWVPISLCAGEPKVHDCDLEIRKWWLEREGLI